MTEELSNINELLDEFEDISARIKNTRKLIIIFLILFFVVAFVLFIINNNLRRKRIRLRSKISHELALHGEVLGMEAVMNIKERMLKAER